MNDTTVNPQPESPAVIVAASLETNESRPASRAFTDAEHEILAFCLSQVRKRGLYGADAIAKFKERAAKNDIFLTDDQAEFYYESWKQAEAFLRKLSPEQKARIIAQDFCKRLEGEGEKFIQDESGAISITHKGKIVSLYSDRDTPNPDLDMLLARVDCPGTESNRGRLVCKWMELIGRHKTKGTATTHRFSAISKDGQRLYIPTKGDRILQLSKDGAQIVPNITNSDGVVVRASEGQEPFKFIQLSPEAAAEALQQFEELVIGKQTTVVPEMAWLAAMQEMLFPFVREEYQSERAIIVRIGPSNSGKTASDGSFLRLHGFKEPITKITPAALQSLRATSGILFLDNQEEHNLKEALQDALIGIATGGEKKTAVSEHKGPRPIVSITTIEGLSKSELRNRSIEIAHALNPADISKFSDKDHTTKVLSNRDRIMSAFMPALVEFLKPSEREEEVPSGAGKFSDNYRALCRLLRAYEKTAQKHEGWADEIMAGWRQQLSGDTEVAANEDLTFVIRRWIKENEHERKFEIKNAALRDGGRVSGILYVASVGEIFAFAQPKYSKQVPGTPNQLGKRLSEIQTSELLVLRENDVPKDSELFPFLKRSEGQRFVGFLDTQAIERHERIVEGLKQAQEGQRITGPIDFARLSR